ncbi:hypothetical protein BU17DRAFT_85997 [Hysterangium stoloniferum]|nr:hypothetical protein BU17DRAFT_85997 [Hysterangium stoloniferum]
MAVSMSGYSYASMLGYSYASMLGYSYMSMSHYSYASTPRYSYTSTLGYSYALTLGYSYTSMSGYSVELGFRIGCEFDPDLDSDLDISLQPSLPHLNFTATTDEMTSRYSSIPTQSQLGDTQHDPTANTDDASLSQGYEVVDNKFLFWGPEGLAHIILTSGKCLVEIPAPQRFMHFDCINLNCVFFKTYYERHSFLHLLINFNCIWVIHIAMYWYYTAFNSLTTALGGAVTTIIMILATVIAFTYIPTTWNNTAHLTH